MKMMMKTTKTMNSDMENIYTMEDWRRDGTFSACVGQYVSEDIYYEMLECVPPAFSSRTIMQVGEPYDNDMETFANLYSTFARDKQGWRYMGHCLKGRTENRIGIIENQYGN